MITIACDDLRRFRALLKRCRPPRTPMNPVPVRVQARGGTLRFGTTLPDLTLTLTRPSEVTDVDWLLPPTVLELIDQARDATVILEAQGKSRVRVRGLSNGEQSLDLLKSTSTSLPHEPEVWSDADASLLTVLHEAGRTSTPEAIRYAVNRIQLQGSAGRVIATDTKQALIWSGLRFPFSQTVLVPAVPIFGANEFKRERVRIGRGNSHIVVRIGPWSVFLNIDLVGKFPDVANVIPRFQSPTTIAISEADARFILAKIDAWPCGETDAGITLDTTAQQFVLRCRNETDDRPTEIRLVNSTTRGSRVTFVFDRKYLIRGLKLGFRTITLVNADKPIVMTDRHRTYLAVGFSPTMAVLPHDEAHIVTSTEPIAPVLLPRIPENLMPSNPSPILQRSSSDIPTEPFEEAEAIRNLLAEATQRAHQLVQLLKAKRKADRAITQVVRSLQALPLKGVS